MEAAKIFGKRLFDSVFGSEVFGCLRSSLDQIEAKGSAGLRPRLRLNAPELADLPWEYLYNSALNRFLVLAVETPLVRYIELPERIRPLAVQPPLKILVMLSSPTDYPQLDVEEEWTKLQNALGDLQKRKLVTLERLDEATLPALQRRLRQSPYHIFHFIGHGGNDVEWGTPVLYMRAPDGKIFDIERAQPAPPPVRETPKPKAPPTVLPSQPVTEKKKPIAPPLPPSKPSGSSQRRWWLIAGMALTLVVLAWLLYKNIELKPALARVTIQVNPTDALVVLDGESLTSSQLRNRPLSLGAHSLNLSREGYKPEPIQFRIMSPRDTTLSYALASEVVSESGVIRVQASLEGRVYIDGEFKSSIAAGETREYDQPLGSHKVEVRGVDETVAKTVTVAKGKTVVEAFRPKPTASPVEIKKTRRYTLRATSRTDLSVDEVESMLAAKGLYDRGWNKGASGLTNDFSLRTIAGEQVVVDAATGLMWQRGGSANEMIYADTEKHIRNERCSIAEYDLC